RVTTSGKFIVFSRPPCRSSPALPQLDRVCADVPVPDRGCSGAWAQGFDAEWLYVTVAAPDPVLAPWWGTA
ncbi:MAG TPA: hypothetical protein VN828_24555, partial [Acidobacteriaceae bacterium]|nr:hypothetical protein [Acidobacteriaceae bacterium]